MRSIPLVMVLAVACGHPEPTAAAPVAAPAPREEPTAQRDETSAPPEDPCGGNTGAACYAEGARLIHGIETTADPARGWAMLERACEIGYGTACYDFAQIRSVGNEHVPRDIDEHVRLVVLSCERGSPDGCNDLRRSPRELREECATLGLEGLCALADHLEREAAGGR